MGDAQRRRRSRGAQVLELLLVLVVGLGVAAAVVAGLVVALGWTGLLALVVVVGGVGLVIALAAFRAASRHWNGAYSHHAWPATGRTISVPTADGCALHVEIDGPDRAPLTVVLAHGLATDRTLWHHQLAALQDSPYRRVTYDARGHGRSSYRRLDPAVEGVRQLADDLGRVIDAVAPQGTLLLGGHGLGGMTVFALLDSRPDLVPRLGALYVLDTTTGPVLPAITFGLPRPFAPGYRLVRRWAVAALTLAAGMPRAVLRVFGLGPYLLAARLLATFGGEPREAVRYAALGLWNTRLRVIADCAYAATGHDEQVALTVLPPLPVIVSAGRNDRVVPLAETHRWAPAVPHVRLSVLDQCGHLSPLEQPAAVNDLLTGIAAETWRHVVVPRLASAAAPAAEDGRPRPRPRPRPLS